MSAFVIDAGAMHRVLIGLFGRSRFGQIVPQFNAGYTMYGEPRSLDPTEVGRALYAMNVEAVMQRYPDCRANPADLPGEHGAHLLPTTYQAPRLPRHPLGTTEMIGAYKAMRCLLYQCAEGDVPDSPLYTELRLAAGELAAEIVHGLPAYDAAAW